ncbi:MAG: hypothetical protein ABID38_01400 [Candidatus Diapherotrites archaeon]
MGIFSFRNVDGVLSIGGLPQYAKDIDSLKEKGISTIVSLEALDGPIARYAEKQGLKVVTLSVGRFKEIPNEKINRFLRLAALAQAREKKIFLHCLQGRDRTMEMTAAYLIASRQIPLADKLIREKPLRFFVTRWQKGVQTHFEKTLNRARKYPRRH